MDGFLDGVEGKSIQKSHYRHTKNLIIELLRLLTTFAGVLREKKIMCAGFNKILTNYISEESLINVDYDIGIV